MPEVSKLIVNDPYSGKNLATLDFATSNEIALAFEHAQKAFSTWRHSPSWRRAEVLLAVASELESRKDEFAQLMVREAGKPLTYANGEVARALGVLRWAAAEVQRFTGELLRLDTLKSGRDGFGIHTRFPRGVIFGITPFNFPLNLVLHKVVPAIASGCSIIIKPSPATPLTAIKVAELFEKHEKGLVQCILADDALTESITRSKEIAMVSFTGSARVGKLVQKQAYDKPVTLELGGNAWVIVMEDAPASSHAVIAKRISGAAFGYAGQSCISVQNVAVAGAHWKDFKNLLGESTSKIAFGDPANSKVISGPVINKAAALRIQSALKDGAAKIEKVSSSLLEGSIQSGNDNLIAPTLLLTPDSGLPSEAISLREEEVFAPVMLAGKFDRLDDLISMINRSKYGLQVGVFTQNLGVIEKIYREVQVGGVIVNDVPTTRYDHQPYGGVKDSGHGREGIRYAMEEMTYSKFLALSSQIPQ